MLSFNNYDVTTQNLNVLRKEKVFKNFFEFINSKDKEILK